VLYFFSAPFAIQSIVKIYLRPARPAAQKMDQSMERKKKRTPSVARKMSCYVGNYYTKFEPSSREKKVAWIDFLDDSTGSLKKIPRILGDFTGN
jgi:hypothetical protein